MQICLNYFAHAIPFLDNPFFVAGTAAPDWVRLLPKVRVGSKVVARHLESDSCPAAEPHLDFCRGILQHHIDDDRFHNSEAFLGLNVRLASRFRELMPECGADESMRIGFVSHITVELLLDAHLIEAFPDKIVAYYRLLDGIDDSKLAWSLEAILQRPIEHFSRIVRRFTVERFLYDYSDDARLLRRINQVMKRVGLSELPNSTTNWLAESRVAVYDKADSLRDFDQHIPA
jgi:hypothetical protein